jgi:hypothetical protein
MPFKLLGYPWRSIEVYQMVIYDHLGKYDPFYMAIHDCPESAF